jgi:hypothetical protein
LLKITKDQPTSGKYWYQYSLYDKTRKDEYWSQFSRATHKLSHQSYLEIGKADRHGKKPISATFWGLLKALSYFFQENPTVSEDVLRALTDFFDNAEKEIPLLYETWPFFAFEVQKEIAERISEYVSDSQESHSRSNLIDDFKSNLINWQKEQRNSKKIIPELEKAMVSIAQEQFLAFIFFEPNLKSCSEKALKTEKTEKEKIIFLLRNLEEKREEFYKRTGYLPYFSEIERFSKEKAENYLTPRKISEFKSTGIKRSAYQAWIALTLILMLEPSELNVIRDGKLQKPEKTISFFWKDHREKSGWQGFVFYSNKIKAGIGFQFGMSRRLRSQSTIVIGKSKEQGALRCLPDPVILVESEEEIGWFKSGEGGIYREHELNKDIDIIPRKREDELIEYFIRQHNPSSSLFVICWENEKGSKSGFRSSRISILEGVGFDQQKLAEIVKTIETI